MAASAAVVERLADAGEPAYGVSTGFGSLATVPIPPARRAQLQRSLLRSHAAGMGAAGRARGRAGDDAAARADPGDGLLRARGPRSPRRSLALLNAGLTPVVPEHGSLGASGDLAPLAHCALALIGEGEVVDRRRPTGAGGARRSPRPGSSRSS